MPKPQKPTFTSYLPSTPEDSSTHASDTSSVSLSLASQDGTCSEPTYLNGELMVNHAGQVIRYIPYSQQSSGQLGELYVTNFRILFQPYEVLPEQAMVVNHQRNKLYREHDVVLANIFAVFHVSKGKRKKLVPGQIVPKSVKNIEIHCKDFRVHNFCFKKTPKDTANQVINAVVHHAFPKKQELLFAFEYQGESSHNDDVPKFNSQWDWKSLLQRLSASSFRVTDVNNGFSLSPSLPQHFVVPSSLTNQLIINAAQHFIENRCLVWCYSHSNGAAVVRMTNLIPDSVSPQSHACMLEATQKAHPGGKRAKTVHVSNRLPTPRDILNSFDKLRDLLMPATIKELEVSDGNWLSLVDDTSWLQHVCSCLKVALSVTDAVHTRTESIVLIEEAGGRDLSPLLSCLVQLLLDPHTRTLNGFQQLVEREWVALGHRFLDRMVLEYNTESSDPCPVFLLFIDCVWQLLQQFPSAFEFSEMYLTSLWDSTCLGLFENFIFNTARDRVNLSNEGSLKRFTSVKSTVRSGKLMSVWDWSKQFTRDDIALFNNPLYKTRTELELKVNKITQIKRNANSLRRSVEEKYPYKLSETFRYAPEIKASVLRPVVSPPLIKFWSHCYLRWLTPVQILSGGSPSEYLQQCVLVEEIIHLKHKINNLQASVSSRPKSNLIFDGAGERGPPKRQWSEAVSSSFPYSPMRTSARVSLFETTVSHYLEKSLVNFTDDDAISMDSLECSLDDSVHFSTASAVSYVSTPKKGPILLHPGDPNADLPSIDSDDASLNHSLGHS